MWCNYNLLGFKEHKKIHAKEELSEVLRKNNLMAVRNAAQ